MTEYRTKVSAGDGLDYVLSDGTLDRHGTRINPDGWDLDTFRANPVALWSHGLDAIGRVPIGTWENVRAEGGKLLGRLRLAAKGTSDRIDELISLVQQGILRAVSVGFEVIEEGKRDSGFEIMRQALTEASLVAVGSNKNALQQARALNISEPTLRMVFGEQAGQGQRSSPGEHAAPPPSKAKKMDNLPLSKRIENAQTDLNTARDAYQAHIAADDYDIEQANTFKEVVDHRVAKLDSLKDAEKTLMLRSSDHDDNNRDIIVKKPERKPLGIRGKDVEPADLLIRAASVHLLSYLQRLPFETVLEQRYPDHKQTLEYTRAAVAAATTTTAGWAQELVATVQADFLTRLNPDAVLPKLAPLGTQLSFGPGAGIIKVPSRTNTPSITGSFIAEGSPIPVRKLGLTSITLTPHKVGVISAFTREIVKYSNPQIEGIVREAIVEDTSITLDTLLLDATAESAIRPAGLIFGVSAKTASVLGGYKAILADIGALLAPFTTANAGRRLVLIMNPAQAFQLAMAPGPDGTFGWAGSLSSRFTVIESTNVLAGYLYMIDAADFVSVTGAPEFEVSDQVTLHMEDTAPLPIVTGAQGSGVVASPTISTWQEAKIALRMLMDTTWAMRRTGMVQYMSGVNWVTA